MRERSEKNGIWGACACWVWAFVLDGENFFFGGELVRHCEPEPERRIVSFFLVLFLRKEWFIVFVLYGSPPNSIPYNTKWGSWITPRFC